MPIAHLVPVMFFARYLKCLEGKEDEKTRRGKSLQRQVKIFSYTVFLPTAFFVAV